jgi:hypothetical protein
MFDQKSDLGAELFKSWTEKQRIDEIGKLVQGYRDGLPVGILCKMAETIAGNPKKASKMLKKILTNEECELAVKNAEGGMKPLVKSFLE